MSYVRSGIFSLLHATAFIDCRLSVFLIYPTTIHHSTLTGEPLPCIQWKCAKEHHLYVFIVHGKKDEDKTFKGKLVLFLHVYLFNKTFENIL